MTTKHKVRVATLLAHSSNQNCKKNQSDYRVVTALQAPNIISKWNRNCLERRQTQNSHSPHAHHNMLTRTVNYVNNACKKVYLIVH